MNIKYTVELYDPHAHTFKVKLEVKNPDKQGQQFSLPNWIPGSYMIRDFAKNITQIKASSGNIPVTLTKLDKSSWQAEPVKGSLSLVYQVYAWDLSVRTAHFDMTHAFFNGTSLYIQADGFDNEAISLEIAKPTEEKYANWHVTTSLTKDKTDNAGFGLYRSENYDDLVDHPIEIGNQQEFEFNVENTTHKMALTGIQRANTERLKSDLTKICQAHCRMFGELPDMKEYIFLVMVTGDGYGGLEHRNSTSLVCARDDLPLENHPEQPEEKYRNFLGLCSHEYFHTWNVKRIKPDAFMPYDLRNETYTRQLWAFEGITSYYDELGLLRAKVISVESYLELLGQTITRVLRGKGRLIQSIADSSFDAWTKFYKQDESAPNVIVSYYAKGGLLALCLDLIIRKQTNNQKSLDDVMRHLWQNYGKKAIGVPEGKIEEIASEVANTDLSEFFNTYLYGVKELPLAELLAEFGINMKLYATTSVDDKGGKAPAKTVPNPVSLGARSIQDPLGVKLTQVFSQEAAEKAGLSAGDIIIAINNLQVTKSNIDKVINSYKPGNKISVHAFRRDELHKFELTLQEAELTSCYLELNKETDSSTTNKRNTWLQIEN